MQFSAIEKELRASGFLPVGYCQCGCGQRTTIATSTSRSAGRVKGQPCPYLRGHNTRVKRPNAEVPPPVVDIATGCWLWQGAKDPNGYGRVGVPGTRRTMLAHRYVYEQVEGPIPAGHHLHHGCENPSCVNPAHMEPKQPQAHLFAHGHAKLTDEQVREIRASAERGIDLANRYGVGRSCISMIRSRQARTAA